MTFAELNAAVSDLRHAVRTFVGENALEEVTVRPPAGDCDEASFLRLVAWSYALVFEAGRVTIAYLLELPSTGTEGKQATKAARKVVHNLRTWSFHNLGFGNNRDLAVSQSVQRWFFSSCGTSPPNNGLAWRKCCQSLCGEVGTIVAHCQVAVTHVLSAPDDGQTAIRDLRRRIERAWPPHEFDKLVSDAAIRLGMKIDVSKFRELRLGKWRSFLECVPGGDDPETHVIRMIERDLLDYAALVLPIDGRDVMDILCLDPGPKVGLALHFARELFRSGVQDREELLEYLKSSRSFEI